MKEVDAVRERYARRAANDDPLRYSLLNPSALLPLQEKQRALVRWVHQSGMQPLNAKRVLEIGCGSGSTLLDLMRLGFAPEHLFGNELLQERSDAARRSLPSAATIITGDATQMTLPAASFDVVLQSTVFSSLLDDGFQATLARCMWQWVKPGGGVLWYDFTFNNPANPDVRGVTLARVRQLFPGASVWSQRITLAPPIARRVTAVHPSLYTVFNAMPWLRTHLLCWIQKP